MLSPAVIPCAHHSVPLKLKTGFGALFGCGAERNRVLFGFTFTSIALPARTTFDEAANEAAPQGNP